MLIKRKRFTSIFFLVLAFPAAVFAAEGGAGPQGPTVGSAEVATIPALHRPVDRFERLVATIAAEIEAEEEALARRRQRERLEAFAVAPTGVSMATLESIASCESGGDPTALSSDGTYRGKYQFDLGTWEAVGGSGDPAAAPEYEQDYRAALLYAQAGSSPWPVCG